MAIIQDWKIRSRSHECAISGETFVDGDEFYTCIFEDPESDGYLRKDFAAENWEKARETFESEPFSFWKSTFEIPPVEKKTEAIEKHSAEALLRKMIDEDDSTTENARYILAIMLERKKTLKPVDTKETENRKLLFYEHKDNGDLFIVADPRLHLSEISSVQEEVMVLLSGEMEPKPVLPPSRAFTIWTAPFLEATPTEPASLPPSRAFSIWTRAIPSADDATQPASRAFTIWTVTEVGERDA